MFNKVPYGVKVRVKGSDASGYKAQICICSNRFLPFLDVWSDIVQHGIASRRVTFDTFDEAKYEAQRSYQEWISFYKRREEEKNMARKVTNTIVWEHP